MLPCVCTDSICVKSTKYNPNNNFTKHRYKGSSCVETLQNRNENSYALHHIYKRKSTLNFTFEDGIHQI